MMLSTPNPSTALRLAIGLALMASLSACGGPPETLSPEQQARVDALVAKTLKHMRHVPAGGFWLGDPGPLMTDELKQSGAALGPDATLGDNPPFTLGQDNKPPRWVTLDAFSMAQYKVTYGDFDVFVEANGLPAHPPEPVEETWQNIWRHARKSDDTPAGVSWQQAKDYCAWLGKLTGLPVDLPTETQWEFAASNGRKTYHEPYPTDSGILKEGHNHPTFEQIQEMRGTYGMLYPVGRFPSSKLGFHDLVGNGFDWVNDWYAPDTYQSMTTTHNPTGPATGTEKVMRGLTPNESISFSGFPHVDRYHEVPEGITFDGKPWHYARNSFRCIINQADPVSPR